MKNIKRYRLKPDEWSLIDKYRHYKKQKTEVSNVLIIGVTWIFVLIPTINISVLM